MTTPRPRIPVLAAASRELERLVAVGLEPPAGAVLLDVLGDPDRSTWNLGNAMRQKPSRKNPFLDEAWSLLPWKERPGRAA